MNECHRRIPRDQLGLDQVVNIMYMTMSMGVQFVLVLELFMNKRLKITRITKSKYLNHDDPVMSCLHTSSEYKYTCKMYDKSVVNKHFLAKSLRCALEDLSAGEDGPTH